VRVPRRLQENLLRVHAAQQELQGRLGRPASIEEIATHLGLQPDDVLAALEVSPAQHTVSLQAPIGDSEDGGVLGERLGGEDEGLGRVEMRDVLERAMAHLSPRERRIMALRFVEQLPQTEVAKRLGISQMHVSRLQRAAVEHLRQEFGDEVMV
jgi:RNA polymerase sigma-B factor